MKSKTNSPYIILEKYLNLVDNNISYNYIIEVFNLLSTIYTNKYLDINDVLQIKSDLDLIIENLESSLYKPNENINFNTPQKVYDFRINLINELIFLLYK
jgi:hypothetical protein